jgi:hypothetical protein
MARFWKRSEDRSVDELLRANRPRPRDEFASSLLSRIAATPRRVTASPRRVGLALALTVAAVAVASVLGGISAASAGVGGIFHVATQVVSPSHNTKADTSGPSTPANQSKGNDADDEGDDDGGNDGDHHQYQVGVCHWANHKYVLIFVSPLGAANHLAHHPNDRLLVGSSCPSSP